MLVYKDMLVSHISYKGESLVVIKESKISCMGEFFKCAFPKITGLYKAFLLCTCLYTYSKMQVLILINALSGNII